jgi:hypothetical protein
MLAGVAAALAFALLSAPAGAASPAAAGSACAPAVLQSDARTGVPSVDATLATSSAQVLAALPELANRELRSFSEGNGDAVADLIADSPPADDVIAWWDRLSTLDQLRLTRDAPEVVGNLDGVPYRVRDQANRAVLEREVRELRTSLAPGLGKGVAQLAVTRLAMLSQIEDSLAETPGGPARSLVVLDTRMPGRAAVAVGDLDTADYVSFVVPGALLSIREHMAEWTKVAADLFDEQTHWEDLFGDASTVATVSWIGYQTPDITNVLDLDLAEQGANFMASTVNGLDAIRTGNEPYVSVFAHSYGATAAMLALGRGDMSVDALAMIGSPGGAASRATDLAVPKGKVWVGEAAWDPVVHTGFFGTDPGSPAFGAKTMSVAGNTDPVTGAALSASVGHDWYLEPGTESLRNLSLIGIDRGTLVTDGSADDADKNLAMALDSSPDSAER